MFWDPDYCSWEVRQDLFFVACSLIGDTGNFEVNDWRNFSQEQVPWRKQKAWGLVIETHLGAVN